LEPAVAKDGIQVRFWGVRGSIACPGDSYVRYGGNTACVEMRCGPHLLIFDGGTGLRELGRTLDGAPPIDADIFFSHSHLDHVAGVPFFKPLYEPQNRFRLWAGHLKPDRNLMDVLCQMMAAPLFPIPPAAFDADTEFNDFTAGERLEPRDGVTLDTAPLNHPNGATGYRVRYNGRSVAYVTDTEHQGGRLDDTILGLIGGADLFIYDSTYTETEYPAYAGWGHSTWQQGLKLAQAAGVRRFVIFHHDPSHDDLFMDEIAAEAERLRPGTVVAREGMLISL
jgi:phosphoribosyl 1,2-cyclic phosphodiesterase